MTAAQRLKGFVWLVRQARLNPAMAEHLYIQAYAWLLDRIRLESEPRLATVIPIRQDLKRPA